MTDAYGRGETWGYDYGMYLIEMSETTINQMSDSMEEVLVV